MRAEALGSLTVERPHGNEDSSLPNRKPYTLHLLSLVRFHVGFGGGGEVVEVP